MVNRQCKGEARAVGQPPGRALDAIHVRLVRGCHVGLPGVRPVASDGSVLHVLGVLAPHDHLRGLDVGAAFERNHGIAVLLLVLHKPGWREWHRVGQQQDGVHVLPHRHCEHARVHDGGLVLRAEVHDEAARDAHGDAQNHRDVDRLIEREHRDMSCSMGEGDPCVSEQGQRCCRRAGLHRPERCQTERDEVE